MLLHDASLGQLFWDDISWRATVECATVLMILMQTSQPETFEFVIGSINPPASRVLCLKPFGWSPHCSQWQKPIWVIPSRKRL